MSKTAEAVPTIWTNKRSDALNTGTWRSAIPVYQNRPSPCHLACPVHGHIPVWIEMLRKGLLHEAWQKIVENNPFPSVTGRVCHHPCEDACNRSEHDANLSIRLMERYLADLALEKGWLFPETASPKKEKVAIIGGGPAGLSAAYQLKLKGYTVEIFETKPKLGGLLRYGIPNYRLPAKVLDQELNRLAKLGIKYHTETAITGAAEYKQLQNKYDALFIATGAQRPRKLAQFENNPETVLDGLDLLYRINSGQKPELGPKVLVIGGGNTALDTARCAKRLAADVTIVYRRTENQMPSQETEILEAKEEGIRFTFLASPVKLEKENETQKLVCQKMQLGEKDASGRPRPEPIKDAFFALETDTVIMALGSDIETPPIDELETQDHLIKVDANQQTSVKNILAGGDLTSNDRFVSSALGAGKIAAEQIDLLLGGTGKEEHFTGTEVLYEQINTFYFPKNPATTKSLLPASERTRNFQEVQLGLTEQQALYEAARCFNCGWCVSCDNCFYFCPDMAIKINNPGNGENYTILEQYCKGCGLCVKECPRGAIVLKEESK
ncbi:MAG: FAD-dependent oxidoreductase [Firmicutes bacterium]|nr:FAD-dependent oxidoreductase [Bacillota bacterium]